MTSGRDQRSEEAFAKIEQWIKDHPGRWWRMTEIERDLGLKIPAITQILKRMRELNMIERNDDNRKKHNGKIFPTYIFRAYVNIEDGPAWLSPKPPMFASRQVLSIRFIKDGKNKHDPLDK